MALRADMGHRERVLRAIEHKEVDRTPCYFRADDDVCERIRAARGLSSEVELLNHFGSDAMRVFPPYRNHALPDLKDVESTDEIYDAAWPDSTVLDLEGCVRQAREARETGLAVYGGVWASVFTISRHMLGEERYLMSMATEPDLISCLVTRLADYFLELNKAYLDACADYVDVYYLGSDFGTQISLFVSPEMFRRFYKPELTRLARQAKEYGLKVMFHTCGAVSEIIPDLIDCGIDVLDPVQASAVGMDPKNLAARFKGKIAFHGGISTQKTLPFGTVEEVRQETRKALDVLGPTGYIIAPDHTIVGDTPFENIDALFQTVLEGREAH